MVEPDFRSRGKAGCGSCAAKASPLAGHRVRRLMRRMGLEAIYRAPKTSTPHPERRIHPYLLRNVAVSSSRSGLVRRYQLHPRAPRIPVPRGDHGLGEGQAPLFAILVTLVNYPLRASHFDEISEKLPIVHFLMVVAAIWFGCNNAARDIVGEWTIYKRERMVTLKLRPLCLQQAGCAAGPVHLPGRLHAGHRLLQLRAS